MAGETHKSFLERLGTIDRRVIFVLMGLALTLPLIRPLGLPFQVSPGVQDTFDAIDAVQPGQVVLLQSDFDPASMPEIYPFLLASMRHLFQKKAKVVCAELWPAAPPLVTGALKEMQKEFGLVEGEDFVHLGFKVGSQLVMIQMGEDLWNAFPADVRKVPVAQIPLMQRVRKLSDFALMVNVSSGFPGAKEWVQYAQTRFNFKMVTSVTAVMAPDVIPYYQAGQLSGLSGGMAGSAEYEKLLGIKGTATAGMDVLSFGHLLIIFAIIVGNVSYFATRKK